MIEPPSGSAYGALTLVSYLPEPLRRFLQNLWRELPREHHSDPHVTVLPPRPLRVPIEIASQYAFGVLAHFSRFEVELSEVHCFPNTNVLYLDMLDGKAQLHRLHDALNREHLAGAEKFQYRPHLTLGGPIQADAVGNAIQQVQAALNAAQFSMRFPVFEVAALWQPANGRVRDWQRLWTRRLGTAVAPLAAQAGTTTQKC